MAYREFRLQPSEGGLDEYQAGDASGEIWDDEIDLVVAMRHGVAPADLYELGVDELPGGVEDIRGRIQNEPARVFGWLDRRGDVQYACIVQV
jgi:hypothetical protein